MLTEVIGPAAAVPAEDTELPAALETAPVMALDMVPAPLEAVPLPVAVSLPDMAPDVAALDMAPLDIAPLDMAPLDTAPEPPAELAALLLAGAALLAAGDDPVLPVLAEPQPAMASTAATPTAPITAILLLCITTPLL
ncbi:MAG: hypothetical protein M3Y77_13760 [Actinomycetota bacterium]|nr:hypothetical protein [Actinomycetota bacterium]